MEPKKNTIETLMEQGKTNGKLTTKEITDALEELDDRDEWDVDDLLIYDDSSTPAQLVRAVRMLTDLGESVRCAREIPEELRCRKIKKLTKGVISDVE